MAHARLLAPSAWLPLKTVANGSLYHLNSHRQAVASAAAAAVASAQQQRRLVHNSSGDVHSGDATTSSSSSSSSAGNDNDNRAGFTTAYRGFFALNHKRLKLASLVNTAASLAAAPAIVALSDASPLARALVAAGAVGFGVGTTAGLHWFTAPYVHELRLSRRGGDGSASGSSSTSGSSTSNSSGGGGALSTSDVVRARTLTLFGRPRWTEFALGDVTHPDTMRPLVTFKAKGRSFYVDRESEMAPPELLRWLTPIDPAALAAAEAATAAAVEADDANRGGEDGSGAAQQQGTVVK